MLCIPGFTSSWSHAWVVSCMPPTSGTSKHKFEGSQRQREGKLRPIRCSGLPASLRKGLYGSDKHCKRGPLLGGMALLQVLVS